MTSQVEICNLFPTYQNTHVIFFSFSDRPRIYFDFFRLEMSNMVISYFPTDVKCMQSCNTFICMCHKQLIFKLAPERSIDEYSILHHGDLEFLYKRKMYVAMQYVKPPRLMFVYMCHQHGTRMTKL